MSKILFIHDYNGQPMKVTITDFDQVKSLTCKVITGDEVLTVEYMNGTTEVFDPYPNERDYDFLDGEVNIPLDQVDKFSEFTDSVEMLQYFGNFPNARLVLGLKSLVDLIQIDKESKDRKNPRNKQKEDLN